MPTTKELVGLLAALDAALSHLELLAVAAPDLRLNGIVARRRSSLRVLRRSVRQPVRRTATAAQSAPDLALMIAEEWRIAHLIEQLLGRLPATATLRPALNDLRADVEEAALCLRLLAQREP